MCNIICTECSIPHCFYYQGQRGVVTQTFAPLFPGAVAVVAAPVAEPVNLTFNPRNITEYDLSSLNPIRSLP